MRRVIMQSQPTIEGGSSEGDEGRACRIEGMACKIDGMRHDMLLGMRKVPNVVQAAIYKRSGVSSAAHGCWRVNKGRTIEPEYHSL